MEKKIENKKIPQLQTQPITTIVTFCKVIMIDIKNFIKQNLKLVSLVTTLSFIHLLLHFIELSLFNDDIIQQVDQILLFVGFWTGLGILSSIGLGSGLHTFILYLGPKIARFVMASQECQKIVQMKPHRWALMPSFECQPEGAELNFWNIFNVIKIEAIIWGFGTAIGELPPYIISKSARLAGKQNEELQSEMQSIKEDNSLKNRIKQKIFDYVKKYSFITVLIMASIPNPLFDLAGLTCGYLLIDFKTFFIATAIGKSLIKVNLQVMSIILILSKESVNFITQYLGSVFGQDFEQKTIQFINDQKKKMLDQNEQENDGGNLLGTIWNMIIISIVLYFVFSLINSKVESYYQSSFTKKIKQF